MYNEHKSKYYIVDERMLPEVFTKVVKAKQLIETGEASTIAEATSTVGLSRSAFYKYKDSITPFQDLKRGRIITFQITIRDRAGGLSALLSVFADTGANILTINQSIPINGIAQITISVEIADMQISGEELMEIIQKSPGVKKVDVTAG